MRYEKCWSRGYHLPLPDGGNGHYCQTCLRPLIEEVSEFIHSGLANGLIEIPLTWSGTMMSAKMIQNGSSQQNQE